METVELTLWRKKVKILQETMTSEELEKNSNSDGDLKVTLVVDIDKLRGDVDELNDIVSDFITGSECGLTDIGYKLVGATSDGDAVVQVTGNVIDHLNNE